MARKRRLSDEEKRADLLKDGGVFEEMVLNSTRSLAEIASGVKKLTSLVDNRVLPS